MTWATDRRLDYIDWRLAVRGGVQRGDLMRVFDISQAQASADLNEFLRRYPRAIRYDKSAKRYVADGAGKKRWRGTLYDTAWRAEDKQS